MRASQEMCVGLSLPQEQIERTKGLPLHIGFYLCIYLVLTMYLSGYMYSYVSGYMYVSIWLYNNNNNNNTFNLEAPFKAPKVTLQSIKLS